MADALRMQERSGDALARAHWSLALQPNARAWLAQAGAFWADGRIEEALEAVTRGLALGPEGSVARRLTELKEELE